MGSPMTETVLDRSISGIQFGPKISVVIPVHNGAEFLAQTLQSIFQQTCTDFEVLVIDDASTDCLTDVLAQIGDARLRVFHLPKNVGVSAARNFGISKAKGEYIAFCDADDICLSQRLERQVQHLDKNPMLGFCGTAFLCFDQQEDKEIVKNPIEFSHIQKSLMRGNCFGLSTIMARANILREYSFNPDLGVAEDYDLWTRLVARGIRAENLPDVLLKYRLHPGQASRSKGEKLDIVSRVIRARYCAAILGGEEWELKLNLGRGSPELLKQAQSSVSEFVQKNPDFSIQDFRFFFAWIFQELAVHTMAAHRDWRRMQLDLKLKLDSTYQLNTFLLCFAPWRWGARQKMHLAKLKR
jgi:glycosyltransferase involved in cell wall biosynthesis